MCPSIVRTRAASFLLASLLLATSLAAALVPVVRATSPGTLWVNGDGTTIDAADTACATPGYATIADAVAAASSGDTIHVCADTYDLSAEITVPSTITSLTILGDDSASTIIDGHGYRILEASSSAITLRDLTLQYGNAGGGNGGAVLADSTVTERVRFIANAAANGGAIAVTATASITDSRFIDNTSGTEGGAIWVRDSGITVSGSTFEGNVAGPSGYGFGGAIYARQADCPNGARCPATDLVITGSTFRDGDADEGGATWANHDTSVSDSSFYDNTSDYLGGGIASYIGVRVASSTFAGNIAVAEGGAIYGGYVTVENGTFAENTAGSDAGGGGGAIFAWSTIEVTNGTFVDNTASGEGDHLDADDAYASADDSGVIVATNSLFVGGDCDVETTMTDRGGNVTSGAAGCPGTAATSRTDLGLGALAENGGPTATIALAPSSEAIDATSGIAGVCPTSVDQRGEARPGGSSTGCDAGAYEFQAPPKSFIVGTSYNGADASCGNTPYSSIQAAVDAAAPLPEDTIHLCAGVHEVGSSITMTEDLVFEGDASTTTFVDGKSATRLFDVPGRAITFRDLTLRNGTASGDGGAVRALNVAAERVAFVGNVATSFGGAIRASGTVSITDGTLTGNQASGSGGAVYAAGRVRLLRTNFASNRATSHGGAVLSLENVEATNGSFTGNSGGGEGGAIRATSGTVTLRGADFSGNWGDYGGAIRGLTVDVSGGSFTDNTAGSFGGAVFADGSARVRGGTFTGNVATGNKGGAVYASTTLDVTGGSYTLNHSGDHGGALRADVLTVVGADFSSNSSTNGGALYGQTSVDVTGGTFFGNSATQRGGAIWGSAVRVTGADFTANTAQDHGGAINGDVSAEVSGGSFTGNSSTGVGGAIGTFPGSGTPSTFVRGSVFVSNTSGEGGAIGSSGPVSITGATFITNLSLHDGGAVYVGGLNAATVLRSSFSGNVATEEGGAVYLGGGASGGPIAIEASTFDANSADSGGAIFGGTTLASIRNSTFVDNTAGSPSGTGGAIHAGGGIDVTNGTFYRNDAPTGGHVSTTGTLHATDTIFAEGTCDAATSASDGVSLASDATCPGDPVDTLDLNLGTLGDWGGTTDTIPLLAGSAAIDVHPASPGCPSATDQRGELRPLPLGAGCDAGAYESTAGSGPKPQPTRTTTQVSSASVTPVDPFWDTAVVSGTSGDGNGGFIEPTGGVTFHVCFDVSAATNCVYPDLGTWDQLGDPVELSTGTGASDGTSGTVMSEVIDPTHPLWQGEGRYVFHASFSSGDPAVYLDSEDDGTNETVRVATVPITLAFTGPTVAYEASGRTTATVSLSAQVSPNIRSCPVTFSVDPSAGVSPAGPYTAWTGGNGTATTTPITFTEGVYAITVSTSGPCSGAPDYTGVLTVAPSTLSPGKGGTGGGTYRISPPGPPKIGFGYAVRVSTTTSKVNRVTVTTTTTRGQLIWTTKNGWRLKGVVDLSTTDGSTAWSNQACPGAPPSGTWSGTQKCASFGGTGILQSLSDGGWVTSSYGRVGFTLTVYDGGSVTTCKGSGKTKSCSLSDAADFFAITMTSRTTQLTSADLPVNWDGSAAIPPYQVQQGSLKVF